MHATMHGIPMASQILHAGGMVTETALDASPAGVGVAEATVSNAAAATMIGEAVNFIAVGGIFDVGEECDMVR